MLRSALKSIRTVSTRVEASTGAYKLPSSRLHRPAAGMVRSSSRFLCRGGVHGHSVKPMRTRRFWNCLSTHFASYAHPVRASCSILDGSYRCKHTWLLLGDTGEGFPADDLHELAKVASTCRHLKHPTHVQTGHESIELTELEAKLFDTLLAAKDHHGLTTVLRCAGGWVRDKLLKRESHDIDIALDDLTGLEFAEKVNAYLEHQVCAHPPHCRTAALLLDVAMPLAGVSAWRPATCATSIEVVFQGHGCSCQSGTSGMPLEIPLAACTKTQHTATGK